MYLFVFIGVRRKTIQVKPTWHAHSHIECDTLLRGVREDEVDILSILRESLLELAVPSLSLVAQSVQKDYCSFDRLCWLYSIRVILHYLVRLK